MAKVTLSVKDRLILQNILPQKGNLLEQTIAKDIIGKCSITQEEITLGKFESDEKGNIKWDNSKVGEKEFTFTEAEISLLKKAVKKLDEEQNIDFNNIETCIMINNLKEDQVK